MNLKRGYKLVRKLHDGQLASWLAERSMGDRHLRRLSLVIYRPGEFVAPRRHCGPLGVFVDEESAQSFDHVDGELLTKDIEMWEVSYLPSKKDAFYGHPNSVYRRKKEYPADDTMVLAQKVRLERKVA